MNSSQLIGSSVAVASMAVLASCATWQEMDRSEKGTAVGATDGAVVGAAVGGPIGAAVGAGVGGYAGHYEAGGPPSRSPSTSTAALRMRRRAIRTLSARRKRRFQQANGLTQTGALDNSTLNALGVR